MARHVESENSFTNAQFVTSDEVTSEELGTSERIFRFHIAEEGIGLLLGINF